MADESPRRRRRMRRETGAESGSAPAAAVTSPVHDPTEDPGRSTPILAGGAASPRRPREQPQAEPAADPDDEAPAQEDRDTERGLRGLVGGGSSQVRVTAALRARDATRPSEEDLAAAETNLTIIRRGWTPPPGSR